MSEDSVEKTGVEKALTKNNDNRAVLSELKGVPVRKIETPARGKNRLFVQSRDVSPEREVIENHHRQGFANKFNFADLFTGNTRTHDPLARYNCGRCNQEYDVDKKSACLLVAIREVDEEAGSCEDWENKCAGDPEIKLVEKSIEAAGYGIAANGIGFGCLRCPFASPAFVPDSRGRELYCGKGDFRTFGTACCRLNGAKLKGMDKNGGYEYLAIGSAE